MTNAVSHAKSLRPVPRQQIVPIGHVSRRQPQAERPGFVLHCGRHHWSTLWSQLTRKMLRCRRFWIQRRTKPTPVLPAKKSPEKESSPEKPKPDSVVTNAKPSVPSAAVPKRDVSDVRTSYVGRGLELSIACFLLHA